MRLSGRYDELLSMVNPPKDIHFRSPHAITAITPRTTAAEEEEEEDSKPIAGQSRPEWELWLIGQGYVPESVGRSNERASVGASNVKQFTLQADIAVDGDDSAAQEASAFADAGLECGPADACQLSPSPKSSSSSDASSYHRPRRHHRAEAEPNSEELLDMLRHQWCVKEKIYPATPAHHLGQISLGSASDHLSSQD